MKLSEATVFPDVYKCKKCGGFIWNYGGRPISNPSSALRSFSEGYGTACGDSGCKPSDRPKKRKKLPLLVINEIEESFTRFRAQNTWDPE